VTGFLLVLLEPEAPGLAREYKSLTEGLLLVSTILLWEARTRTNRVTRAASDSRRTSHASGVLGGAVSNA
jgi:hypothetical protein